MRNKVILSLIGMIIIAMVACSKPASNTPAGNKPAGNEANKPAANANQAGNSSAAKTAPEPKTELKDEQAQKPKGEAKKPDSKAAVPADWIDMVDEVKGYGFQVPAGTKGESSSVGGVDTFVAKTPDDIGIIVYAFKDASLSKEDLLERAEAAMAAMGEKITVGELKGEGGDYSLAEASSVGEDGSKSKVKVLVGTDVSDNYVMFVFTDEAKYESKKATMDAIWGSFEMYSGGASAN